MLKPITGNNLTKTFPYGKAVHGKKCIRNSPENQIRSCFDENGHVTATAIQSATSTLLHIFSFFI